MKKLLLAYATVLLIPGVLSAATLGAYLDCAPVRVAHSPAPFSFFAVLVTLQCVASAPCGSMTDLPLFIGAHPASGELRGTFAPENELFPIVGLTSILCPEQIGKQEAKDGVRSILCTDRVRFVAG